MVGPGEATTSTACISDIQPADELRRQQSPGGWIRAAGLQRGSAAADGGVAHAGGVRRGTS